VHARCWRLALLVMTLVALAPATAQAADGSVAWKTLESEHFIINYPSRVEDVALRVAQVAERAHATLAPVLRHQPREKCQIVLLDDTDGANGFASVLPRNTVTLYVTAPDDLSNLSDHDDWLYGLIAHEYTHILHLDTMEGLPIIYNTIFGKQWAPNQIQPRWFIEGLATYEESRRSSSGRVRSSIFDMMLRAAVLDGHPLGLDVMSSGQRDFPGGNIAYLWGSHFLDFIADRYGDDAIATISREYGRWPIPFGLNRAVHTATGKDYLQLYADWLVFLEQKYAVQIDAVTRRGLREGRRLTFAGQSSLAPRYTPDGKDLVWIQSDGKHISGYRAMPVGKDEREERVFARIDGAGLYDFTPDGKSLVFERGMTWRTNYTFTDLFRREVDGGEPRRLTYGLRVSAPVVSPDGTTVAFTVNDASKQRLAIMPLGDGQARATAEVIWEGEGRFDQVYTPAWSPDGKTLVFSVWSAGGRRDLWTFDLATRQATRLMDDRAMDVDPVYSPDGRFIYFSSDRTGIFNVYALPTAGGPLKQVTNVRSGAFGAAVSPDGKHLAYYACSSIGFDVWQINLDESTWLDAEPYVDDRPDATLVKDDETPLVEGPHAYQPLATLAPQTWSLSYVLGNSLSSATISTGGSDILYHHGWTLGTTFDFQRDRFAVAGSYIYNRRWAALRLVGARSLADVGGLTVDGTRRSFRREIWSGSLSLSLPVMRRPGFTADLAFSYALDDLRSLDAFPPTQPDAAVTRYPELGMIAGVGARLSFASARATAFSIGPVEGRQISLAIRYNDPAIGSDYKSLELTYRWNEFVQMPWAYDQTLALALRGGLEETDRRGDGAYSLGTIGEQDIIRAIAESTRASTQVLHGYPSGTLHGRQFHLLNAEYRIGLAVLEQGLATLPVYVRRLHAALLFDAGFASDEDFNWAAVHPAVGAALRLDAIFGFYEPGTFELGWSRGLADHGETQYWLLLTGSP
jgi:hypothetical protein